MLDRCANSCEGVSATRIPGLSVRYGGDRQTRQTEDRHTDRHRQTQTDTDRDRQGQTETDRDRPTGRQAGRQADRRQTDRASFEGFQISRIQIPCSEPQDAAW